MKKRIGLLMLCFSVCGFAFSQDQTLSLVPWPLEVKNGTSNGTTGSYSIKDTLRIGSTQNRKVATRLVNYLKSELKKQFGIIGVEAKDKEKIDIQFITKRMPTSGKPAYTLEVDQSGFSISSNFEEPAFHAIQTLLQLIPAEKENNQRSIQYISIFDHARFNYRGVHFDVARHFFPVDFIKKYIDYLAYHKINKFHWHLTEDQGWRIEIKKYPLLTEIGGYRNGTIIGRYPGTGNDNIPYGGFYTQEEIKEVVQYATERFIDVIPEIDIPGHSSAAISAYPFLSCFPDRPTHIPDNMISEKSKQQLAAGKVKLVQETWGVFDDVLCPGKEETFTFFENVLSEVMDLFPSKYVHIGGDECPKTHWKECPHCQKRMKDNGLKDEHELQSYFIQRMEKFVNSKHKTIIGWDEILEGGLAPNAVVMSWRGVEGGIEAAKQKHYAIMTPGTPLYFDHTQSKTEDSVTIGGYNPIENVYAYEPIPEALTKEESHYIMGVQANMWTEYMKNPAKVEYHLFPRIAALSEVQWTTKENKNWLHFEKRLPGIFKRYDRFGINYSKAYFDLKATVLPAENNEGLLWKVESKMNNPITINFNNGDSVWGYKQPQLITDKVHFASAYLNVNNEKVSTQQAFSFNKATGKKITLTNEASKNYPGDGAFTLVNGVQNEKGLARSNEFLGFNGTNCEAIIDLGKKTNFTEVIVNTLSMPGSWIYFPQSTSFLISDDGVNFKPAVHSNAAPSLERKIHLKHQTNDTFTARYIKVIVENYGKIPDGQPGGGHNAWLFVDEIEVH